MDISEFINLYEKKKILEKEVSIIKEKLSHMCNCFNNNYTDEQNIFITSMLPELLENNEDIELYLKYYNLKINN